jgi:hypothetical protein
MYVWRLIVHGRYFADGGSTYYYLTRAAARKALSDISTDMVFKGEITRAYIPAMTFFQSDSMIDGEIALYPWVKFERDVDQLGTIRITIEFTPDANDFNVNQMTEFSARW